MADYGLRISSVAGPTDEATIDACAAAGVPIIRTLVKVPPDGRYMTTMHDAIRQFERLCPRLEQAKVKIGIQNHCHREVSSIMGLLYLVQPFKPSQVAAVLDVGHCGLAGDPPDLTVDTIWPHLCLVNLKNAYWTRVEKAGSTVAEFDCYWTTGRDGMGHWPKFAQELKARGYRGDICLSAEYSEGQRVDEYTATDLAFARSLFVDETVGRSPAVAAAAR
jgi:sugar phosphate isomerase/epimerase